MRDIFSDPVLGIVNQITAVLHYLRDCDRMIKQNFDIGAQVSEILLQIRDLTVEYGLPGGGRIRALDRISLEIRDGEFVAVLGESGSGKSTLALSVLRLLPANGSVVGGMIRFRGQNLMTATERKLEEIRGAQIAMVFQNPAMALHPLMRVDRQVAEVIRAHRHGGWPRCLQDARLVLARVFTSEVLNQICNRYPHELSGGERQRVSIAQALACNPALIIADEPTAALDSVMQASVLQLLSQLKSGSRTSFMLITHNPAVLPRLADRVLVLHHGRLVEQGDLRDIYRHPRDSYTADLVRSMEALNA